jgi:thymidylate synthase (FAD)
MLAAGAPRELARSVLPVGTFTEFVWSVDLRNLFHFLRLRTDAHAQAEIRVYAEAVAALTRAVAPRAYAAFEDFQLGAVVLSAPEAAALRGEAGALEGVSAGEAREARAKLAKLRGT